MKSLIAILLSFSFLTPLSAQYTLKVQVDSMPTSKAYLYEYLGTRTKMIDSARTTSPGNIKFELPEETHPGLYRIVVGPNNFWDIIFNKEDIILKTHYSAPLDSLKVLESEENKLLNSYMSYFIDINRKAEAISRLMGLYDRGSGFYNALEKELMNLRMQDPEKISRDIISQHPQTYVARFLKIEQNPVVPQGLGRQEEIDYLIDHFFDNIDFRDSAMIYSPPLITRVRAYFNLFQQAYPPSQAEQKMMNGLDRVMSLAAVSDPVYDFILNDLADGFERSEFETFFAYLTETYLLDASCTDEERSGELSEVLASIKKTEIGRKAPEIIIPLPDGPIILSDIPEPYVLVVFWASWCPHCNQILPQIKQVYNKYHSAGFEIVAISIDKEKSEYEAALKKGNYPWINYSELKGWDCSISYDYGIRATPTMILLDSERKIISKPRNPGMLESLLQDLGLQASK